jgi:hypothetical protein
MILNSLTDDERFVASGPAEVKDRGQKIGCRLHDAGCGKTTTDDGGQMAEEEMSNAQCSSLFNFFPRTKQKNSAQNLSNGNAPPLQPDSPTA